MILGKWYIWLILMIAVPLILRRMGCIRFIAMENLLRVAKVILIISGWFRTLLDILLFFNVIVDNCGSLVYAYGIILFMLSVFHIFVKLC